MNAGERFAPVPADGDALLFFLTTRQHLGPHDTIAQVLERTIDQFNCCPAAIARAIQWLKLDPAAAIGRLRRSELVQLARVLHRFWSQATTETSLVR